MKNSCSGIKEDWCCKGKSFVYCQVFESFCPGILKLLPLQGVLLLLYTQGIALGYYGRKPVAL